jgi:AAA+ superfamily predicted ATPase
VSNEFSTFLAQSLRAGSPLVYCESSEDERVRDEAFDLVKTMPGVALLSWTCTTGLSRIDGDNDEEIFAAAAVPTFERLLEQLVAQGHQHHFARNFILVARDAVGGGAMHEGSSDAGLRFVRLLKDLHEVWEPAGTEKLRRCLVVTGFGWTVPPGLNGYLQTTVLPLPSQDDLLAELGAEPGFDSTLRKRGLDATSFAGRVAGLPLLAVRDIVRRLELPAERGKVPEDPWVLIDRIKKEEIRKTGVLEILSTQEQVDLGGFGVFKRWFKDRTPFLEAANKRPELRPRGVLFLGFPGCGKSHAARWIARELGIPLIALNLGQVQDRWVGASEANFRMALRTLEAVAPVVVLMDEVEKDIAGQGSDSSGVMTRLVGHLLRWLADRKAPVFIVATCNDADAIPVELTRTGRFDANFIVSLPNELERAEILGVIAKKLELQIPPDLSPYIVRETHEFTGAEIHQLLVEAAYKVGVNDRTLTRESIVAAKPSVVPLKHRQKGQDLWAKYEKCKGDGYQSVSDS